MLHKCCDKPDIYEVYYGEFESGFRCWNCKYEWKPGEPHPEFYEIDKELVKIFKK